MKPPLFTVCTPTFNRAALLQRAYESLAQQTLQDFEWLVVDDGSTDNTSDVVRELSNQGRVRMRYFAKPNGGKHTALNLAVREAKGDLFTVIDSDDWFTLRALERMKHHWEQVPVAERPRLKGVCGLFAYQDGKTVGDRFPSDIMQADDLDLLLRYQVEGDKIGFTRTEVMREFPFPEELKNQIKHSMIYVTESLVWHRIGRKYPTRFVNEVFAIKEYQHGGITDRGRTIHVENSKATLTYIHEILNCGRKIPVKLAIKNYANYIRYSLHEKLGLREQMMKVPAKHWFVTCLPIGLLLRNRDCRLLKRHESSRH